MKKETIERAFILQRYEEGARALKVTSVSESEGEMWRKQLKIERGNGSKI